MSGSVVGRQIACHASANLDLAIPNWTEPVEDRTVDNAANRGTNMHLVFAKVMELPRADMRKLIEAMQYVADLRATRQFKVLVEQKMKATWLDSAPDTTADLVLYTQDEIHMLDLKTGKIPVEVVDNTQLLFGAATYGHLAPRAKGVTCHILQPWANGNSSWFADTVTIGKFMADAQAAETAIQKGDTTFTPGDHCQFCPAYPHARGLKGKPLCPVTMKLLYPPLVDEDEILGI
jgi:hypothetical protein